MNTTKPASRAGSGATAAEDSTRGRKIYGKAGPRAIHPDICTSESLAGCSILAQLLFDRLIAQADDQGRLRGSARSVRGQCLPLIDDVTTDAVAGALVELADAKCIEAYEVAGQQLIQISGWWRWQNPRRAYPSRLPPPPGWGDDVFGRWVDEKPSGPESEDLPHSAAASGDLPQSAALPFRSRTVPSPSTSLPVPSDTIGGTGAAVDSNGAREPDLYELHGLLVGRTSSAQKGAIDSYVRLARGDRGLVAEAMRRTPNPRRHDWLREVGDCIADAVKRRAA
jgi:hypothetical protein